jgi:predicted small lipoprotein YifL
MKRMILPVTVLAAVLAGCGDDDPALPDATTSTTPDARPAARVEVTVTPADATAGDTLTMNVAVTNFTLVDPTTTPPPDPKIGEGHFHIYFDDAEDYSAGWTAASGIETTAADAGTHTVKVRLVNSIHMELAPLTEAEATFTLQPGT